MALAAPLLRRLRLAARTGTALAIVVVFAAMTRLNCVATWSSTAIMTSTMENPVDKLLVVPMPPSVEIKTSLFAGTLTVVLRPGSTVKPVVCVIVAEAVPNTEMTSCPVVPAGCGRTWITKACFRRVLPGLVAPALRQPPQALEDLVGRSLPEGPPDLLAQSRQGDPVARQGQRDPERPEYRPAR